MATPSCSPGSTISADESCSPLSTHPYEPGGCAGFVWATTSMGEPMPTMKVMCLDGSPRCSPGSQPDER
jgi:hypothetical protein